MCETVLATKEHQTAVTQGMQSLQEAKTPFRPGLRRAPGLPQPERV